MNPSHHKLLGMEIGGTKLQFAVGDASGTIVQTLRLSIDPTGGAESIRKQIRQGWENLECRHGITAIGVGFGGPVDWQTGNIRVSHQVEGWRDFNMGDWISELTQRPVIVENDANVAALAEAMHGSGKGHQRVFYMTIGSGIGGGMVVDGGIYHGRTPGEVEVGHIRLNKNGDTLESCCSGWAVNKKIRQYIEANTQSLLAYLAQSHPGPEAILLRPALEQGDETAWELTASVADDIAFALSHVVHLFHPDVLVIGGGLSLLGEYLIQPVAARLPQYVMPAFLPPPPVLAAALGENVVPAGALELAKKLINNDCKQATAANEVLSGKLLTGAESRS